MPVALYALTLAALAIGTAEFIIAGLLPALSSDLSVSIPTAGLLVSGYALCVAIGGPVFALLTGRFRRKPMIVWLMGLFALGQVLCALAPSYGWLLAARMAVACGHGLFFGVASVTAGVLVPPERRGAALALVLAGVPVAILIGVPAGTIIGNALGWRAAFWAIGALALVAALANAVLLPADEAESGTSGSMLKDIRALGRQQVYLSYLGIFFVTGGALAVTTFQVPLLTGVTGIGAGLVPLYLTLIGVGAIAGVLAGGWLADWKLMPSLMAILALGAVVYGLMFFTQHQAVAMAITMMAASACGYAFSTPLQTRIIVGSKDAPKLAATLIATAFNFGYAAGASAGAALLSHGGGYQYLSLIGMGGSAVATAVVGLSWWMEGRAGAMGDVTAKPE